MAPLISPAAEPDSVASSEAAVSNAVIVANSEEELFGEDLASEFQTKKEKKTLCLGDFERGKILQ